MTTNDDELSVRTWQTLHNNHEKYEHYALVIKLFSISLVVVSLCFTLSIFISLLLLAILWLQEGIWKTYQARTSDAIIRLEHLISNSDESDTCQLYSHWQNNRPNSQALVLEYIKSALKPTVIFPYLPLMVVVLIA
jgi:hypothetical protein